PTTAPTSFPDDLVGAFEPLGRRSILDRAWDEQRIVREGDPEWRDDVPVRVEAIPVRRDSRVIGVIARNTNLLGVRTPSRLELSYLDTAGELTKMIATGRFPTQGEQSETADSPRVGDGFLRTDADGLVTYASPNAISAYRRLGLTGDLVGESLADKTSEFVELGNAPTDAAIVTAFRGRVPQEVELESDAAFLLARTIPLVSEEGPTGALILLRDVTELRLRERELMSKEATIREIHHRVKNNLQTVAALLRLQARRIDVPEGRQALEEAERRVGSIAIVHETLSRGSDEAVDFDDIADRLRSMVADVASASRPVRTTRCGAFGVLPGEVATPLAMVITELMQNAAEHAFDAPNGTIALRADRGDERLRLEVADDGRGLPDGFDAASLSSLGISIVSALVESELGGVLSFESQPGAGTVVSVDLPIHT
ncbi:MAG: sensor histidine kinase, partial [Nocardioidaceae bacterium]